MKPKLNSHFYYIDLSLNCYEVVWSEHLIDMTNPEKIVSLYTTRYSLWETRVSDLYTSKIDRMLINNGEFDTIEDLKGHIRLTQIESIGL